jgi:hypothetical protein
MNGERRDVRALQDRCRQASRYSQCRSLVAAAVLLITCPSPGRAEPRSDAQPWWQAHLALTASNRVRGEFVNWFEPYPANAAGGANRYNFMGNQFRLGLRLTWPQVLFYAEMQDTTLLSLPNDASTNGTPPTTRVGNLGPGALYYANTRQRDQNEPFLKQGYITLRELPQLKGVSTTLGRIEYSDGLEAVSKDPVLAQLERMRIGQRLIGPFGYTHVTRSFDSVRGVYDAPDLNVTAWGSRPTQGGFEVSANPELDIWVAGLAVTLKRLPRLGPSDVRWFYFYYEDDRDQTVKVDNRPLPVRKADTQNIAIHTWGGDVVTVNEAGPGKCDGLLWGVVQGGSWGEQAHFAWAYAVEGGYQFPALWAAPWLRAGYDASSGDSDPNDNLHGTFFQLLPTARIYAQFPFYNLMNSQDLFAQLLLKPVSPVFVRIDYHWLQTTAAADLWYSGGGATNATIFGFAGLNTNRHRALAHVVDFAVTVNPLKWVTADVYYGHAFGQSAVKQLFEGSNADYGFVELTLRY